MPITMYCFELGHTLPTKWNGRKCSKFSFVEGIYELCQERRKCWTEHWTVIEIPAQILVKFGSMTLKCIKSEILLHVLKQVDQV